jgi:hypothetical protein
LRPADECDGDVVTVEQYGEGLTMVSRRTARLGKDVDDGEQHGDTGEE